MEKALVSRTHRPLCAALLAAPALIHSPAWGLGKRLPSPLNNAGLAVQVSQTKDELQ